MFIILVMATYLIVSKDSGLEFARSFTAQMFGLSVKSLTANPDVWCCNSTDIKNDTIKIATVKELTRFVSTKPVSLGFKLVVLPHFHSATIEAQNAMLKLLEDSAAYIHFLLFTNATQRILPTILSRAQVIYEYEPHTDDDVYGRLVKYIVTGDLDQVLVFDSDGIDMVSLLRLLRQYVSEGGFSETERKQLYSFLINAHKYYSVYLSTREILFYLAASFRTLLNKSVRRG